MGKEKRTSKEVSLMVGGGALLLNVLAKLVRALSARGISAEEIRELDSPSNGDVVELVADWMASGLRSGVNQCAPPSDWWEQILAFFVRLCNFDENVPHNGLHRLNGRNFPFQLGVLDSKPVELISIWEEFKRVAPTRAGSDGLYEDEVRAYLARIGFRPATIVELLQWWVANCSGNHVSKHEEEMNVVALGTKSRDGGYPMVHRHVFSGVGNPPRVFRHFFISNPAGGIWFVDRRFAAVKIDPEDEEVVS